MSQTHEQAIPEALAPAELRERLIREVAILNDGSAFEPQYSHPSSRYVHEAKQRREDAIESAGPVVSLVLDEIEAAGYRLVPEGEYGWPIHANADGSPEISVVCGACHKTQYYWPVNEAGELEVSPREIECGCTKETHVLVEAGRLERLMCLAKIGAAGCSIVRPAVGEEPQWMCRCDPLQPGDLEGAS